MEILSENSAYSRHQLSQWYESAAWRFCAKISVVSEISYVFLADVWKKWSELLTGDLRKP